MKKTGIINQPISNLIAGLGHTDAVVIADAGLPIPREVQRIDLALKEGVPSFLETTRVVMQEMQVERAIIAEEMIQSSPQLFKALEEILGEIPVETITHLEFKEQTVSAQGIIRTGEYSPYANIILIAGVVF